MKFIILGCGRSGSLLACKLASEGNHVTVIDNNRSSFALLGAGFTGKLLVGNGFDEGVLQKAGIEQADVFIAMTNFDNANLMAAQVAKHFFNVPRVICRLDDPGLEEVYRGLGMETICHTQWEVSQIEEIVKRMKD